MAAQLAKWSVVVLIALALLAHLSTDLARPGQRTDTEIGFALIGAVANIWVIVAICVWWQP